MFNMSKPENQEALDSLIDRVIHDMEMIGPTHEEYPQLLNQLERLTKLKVEEKPERVSRDTMAVIAANLIGILIVVAYEQKHVMTSKAFGNILKPKADKQMTP